MRCREKRWKLFQSVSYQAKHMHTNQCRHLSTELNRRDFSLGACQHTECYVGTHTAVCSTPVNQPDNTLWSALLQSTNQTTHCGLLYSSQPTRQHIVVCSTPVNQPDNTLRSALLQSTNQPTHCGLLYSSQLTSPHTVVCSTPVN